MPSAGEAQGLLGAPRSDLSCALIAPLSRHALLTPPPRRRRLPGRLCWAKHKNPRHAQQPHPQVAAVVADLGRPALLPDHGHGARSARHDDPCARLLTNTVPRRSSNGTKCASTSVLCSVRRLLSIPDLRISADSPVSALQACPTRASRACRRACAVATAIAWSAGASR